MIHHSKAPTIQRLALAAQQTYTSHHGSADIDFMASMGTYGIHDHNVARELMNKFCKNKSNPLPEPYVITLPVMVRSDCERKLDYKEFYMFLPHQWFAMVNAPASLWDTVFGHANIPKFWKGHKLDQDPKLVQNDIKQAIKANVNTMVPISLHGDGGSFSRTDSLMVISVRAMTSASNVAHSQLFLIGIPKTCVHKSINPHEDTMRCLWSVLKWSFTALLSGKHPAYDHQGKPWKTQAFKELANKPLNTLKLKGCVFALTGDLEYFQNELKIRAHSYTQCCWLCQAEKTETCPYNDFRPKAIWRTTVYKPDYHRTHPPSDHPIWSIPGIVTESIHIDSLRTNEEGTAAHTLGNIFFDFVVGSEWAGTQQQKLTMIFNKILQLYVDLGIDRSNQITTLNMGNFCTPDKKHSTYPCLSSIKARHVRYLVPVCLKLCEEAVGVPGDDSTTEYRKYRYLCTKWLEAMYKFLDCTEFHLTAHQQKGYSESTLNFLLCYTKCSKLADAQGLKKWNIVPKHHFCAHMIQQSEWLNPKHVTTYAGETMVGFMVQLGHSCLNGTPAFMVSKNMCWKMRLAMYIRLYLGNAEE